MRASALGRTYALAVFVLLGLAAVLAADSGRERRDRRRRCAAPSTSGTHRRHRADAPAAHDSHADRAAVARRPHRDPAGRRTAGGQGCDLCGQQDRRQAVPLRRRAQPLQRCRVRLLRQCQLRAPWRWPDQAPAALTRVHELGRGRQGPVDHRVHEPGSRLRRDRRACGSTLPVRVRAGRTGARLHARAAPTRLGTRRASSASAASGSRGARA